MKKSTPRAPTAPKTLSTDSRRLWRKFIDEYAIVDLGGLTILRSGLEALDLVRDCEGQIGKEGRTFTDRFGQVKGHPLLATLRDARAQWLASIKALNLDLEPLKDRPGRPGGS